LSSEELADAIIAGINDAGADVLDIGLCGTEVVYFATGDLEADGGIMVTASHNPADYNGLKLVREQSKPISADTGLLEIRGIAEGDNRRKSDQTGKCTDQDVSERYVERLLSFVDLDDLKSLKIACNAGNGGAGLAIDLLEPHLPFEFIKVHHEPDGNFPNGVPNPMLEENRGPTIDAIRRSGADFGIAWSRCWKKIPAVQ
jgi:phosphomannomutase